MAAFVRFGGVVLNLEHVSAVEWFPSTKDCHVYTVGQREASAEREGMQYTEKGGTRGLYRFTGENVKKVWEYFTLDAGLPGPTTA